MKLRNIKISFAALAALTLASCSEGQYWNEPNDPGAVYAFPKPAETLSIPADAAMPTSYEVSVRRNTSVGAVSVPVTFTSSSPLLTGESSVSFADGQNEAKYVINISNGAKAGVTYTAKVALTKPEGSKIDVDPSNLTFTLNLSQVLVLQWVGNGVANTYSSTWVANETPVAIPVEEAINWPVDGQRLMRLVSPYWYFEPEYCEEGYNIQFYLDAEGNAAGMYQTYTYIGESSNGEYYFFGCPANYGCSFYNEGNIYVMDGVMGYAASPTAAAGAVSAGWYETLQFQWVPEIDGK